MKISNHLDRLESSMLQPLHGLEDGDWHRAPTGKWSIVQIVQHCSIGIDLVARSFHELADTTPMERQSKPHQTVLRHLTLGVGQYPGALFCGEFKCRPTEISNGNSHGLSSLNAVI